MASSLAGDAEVLISHAALAALHSTSTLLSGKNACTGSSMGPRTAPIPSAAVQTPSLPPLPPPSPAYPSLGPLGRYAPPTIVRGSRGSGKTRLLERWILETRAAAAAENRPLLVLAVTSGTASGRSRGELKALADFVLTSLTAMNSNHQAFEYVLEWQSTRAARAGGAGRAPCLLVLDEYELSADIAKNLSRVGVDVVLALQPGAPTTEGSREVSLAGWQTARPWRTWAPLSAAILAASGKTPSVSANSAAATATATATATTTATTTATATADAAAATTMMMATVLPSYSGLCLATSGCPSCSCVHRTMDKSGEKNLAAAVPAVVPVPISRHLYVDTEPDEAAEFRTLLDFALDKREAETCLTLSADAVRARVLRRA